MDEPETINAAELTEAIPWPPIPTEEMRKGNTLTPEVLIGYGAMSGEPGGARWAFAILRLRDDLTERSIRQGKPLSIRISDGGLHINTDPEASEYHHQRGEGGLAMVRRQVGCLANLVNVGNLSQAQAVAHDRKLCVWGARMAALKRAPKMIEQTE